jgi:hypothetical protein
MTNGVATDTGGIMALEKTSDVASITGTVA